MGASAFLWHLYSLRSVKTLCIVLICETGGAFAGTWNMPGGKADPGETPEQTVARETKEEIGIKYNFQGCPSVQKRVDHRNGNKVVNTRNHSIFFKKVSGISRKQFVRNSEASAMTHVPIQNILNATLNQDGSATVQDIDGNWVTVCYYTTAIVRYYKKIPTSTSNSGASTSGHVSRGSSRHHGTSGQSSSRYHGSSGNRGNRGQSSSGTFGGILQPKVVSPPTNHQYGGYGSYSGYGTTTVIGPPPTSYTFL